MPSAPLLFLYLVIAINVITFFAFGIDKRRARLGRTRIKESTLIGLGFATGLIGGWIGMKTFRHKTQKTSFRVKFALVSVFNLLWIVLGVWYWFENR